MQPMPLNLMRHARTTSVAWCCSSALALTMLCASVQAQMALPRHAPYPGGVAVVKLGEVDAPVMDVAYGGNRVLTVKLDDGLFGIIGIPLDAKPGSQKLTCISSHPVDR